MMFLIDIAADCHANMIKLTFEIKLHDFDTDILKNVHIVTELFFKNQKNTFKKYVHKVWFCVKKICKRFQIRLKYKNNII